VNATAEDLMAFFTLRLNAYLEMLRSLVEIESCTHDSEGVDRVAAYLADRFRENGASVEFLRASAGASGLLARWRSQLPGSRVMLLGHLDTVWPRGTLAGRPFRLCRGRAFGPGIFDMKAGLLLCLMVCEALSRLPLEPGGEVLFFFSPDEEASGAAGLKWLREVVPSCQAVLCLEPPLPGGAAKTSRKGVGEFTIRVEGIAAHAGTDHPKGANAIAELCRLVPQLEAMTHYSAGVTVNVGTFRGGTAPNVVPDCAEVALDFRFPTEAQGRELESRIRSLTTSDSRCRLHILGGIERMPLERTAAVVGLYEKARRAAAEVGMQLDEGSSGGSSDGSFTASMGIPTLDGLGVDGDGAHAAEEHVIVEDIPRRAAFLCRMLRALRGDDYETRHETRSP